MWLSQQSQIKNDQKQIIPACFLNFWPVSMQLSLLNLFINFKSNKSLWGETQASTLQQKVPLFIWSQKLWRRSVVCQRAAVTITW